MAKNKIIKILIVSPKPDQIFELNASPVETDPIILSANIIQDGTDITGKVNINWKLRLSWATGYKTYQTLFEISGNPAEVKVETGGILRVRAAVVIDGKEYSSRIKANIVGTNPTRDETRSIIC
ncbi:hypothetical protein HZC34_06370 [Candidatus Saganbacteria bacterium]|nr:hypothetical protein [Candidatus Saganbacteria bacterium]